MGNNAVYGSLSDVVCTQVLLDLERKGKTDVRCPVCGSKVSVVELKDRSRLVSCDCRFLHSVMRRY